MHAISSKMYDVTKDCSSSTKRSCSRRLSMKQQLSRQLKR